MAKNNNDFDKLTDLEKLFYEPPKYQNVNDMISILKELYEPLVNDLFSDNPSSTTTYKAWNNGKYTPVPVKTPKK